MRVLSLIALLTGAFALSASLEDAFRQWSRRGARAQSALEAILGDSRRLFANHFFVQSDVYMHGGYYPSIFDLAAASPNQQTPHDEDHQCGPDCHHDQEQQTPSPAARPAPHQHQDHSECTHDFLGQPRNWIDAFGRHFFPSRHTHLDETEPAAAREILPLLRLSAELDPQRVETYTVAAYWLRLMGKNDEAIQFLREGLRANPDSHEILFELGASYELKADTDRARNLWELALKRWEERQERGEEPDRLVGAQILTRLARLESRAGHPDQTVAYLEKLKRISPSPQSVEQRIAEVKAGQPFDTGAVN